MQILAIVSLIFALAILFKNQTKQILYICLGLLSSASKAKIGNLEVQISKELEDISKRMVKQAAWIQILLSEMTKDEMGLLLQISKVNRYSATDALKTKLRSLRAKGLIQHDMSTMAESKNVWLTELGHELAKAIEIAGTVKDQQK